MESNERVYIVKSLEKALNLDRNFKGSEEARRVLKEINALSEADRNKKKTGAELLLPNAAKN